MALRQTTSVIEYLELFERLRTRLLLEHRMLSEQDFIDAFIGGLMGEIKAFVKVFKPQSLEDAYEHALHLEGAVEYQFKRLRFVAPTKTPPIASPQSKPSATPPLPKNALMEQRRALGLCFKCGEKYYPGHNCKIKVQMMLGQEEISHDQLPGEG
jgi:hypothetical protein